MSQSSMQNRSHKDQQLESSINELRGPSHGDDEPDKPTVIKVIKKPKN